MKTAELKKALDRIAPLSLQESWDNSGMQIDLGTEDADKILVALEITSDVIEEAILKKADFIVTHHPLIFNPVKKLNVDEVTGNYILRLVRAGIPVYSSHTCFDAAPGGNNDYLLRKLGMRYIFRLPVPGEQIGESKIARMGFFETPVFYRDFCEKLKSIVGDSVSIKVSGSPEKLIQKVALCTGAGGEFWKAAYDFGADVFVSGDIKHHEAQAAKELGMCLVDAGHYGTEWLFVHNMAKKLKKICGPDAEIIESAVNQNPYDRVL